LVDLPIKDECSFVFTAKTLTADINVLIDKADKNHQNWHLMHGVQVAFSVFV